jgi:hypothetical protein
MTYKPGDTYIDFFTTEGADGASQNADSLPSARMVHNGADDGSVTLTVTNVSTGYYKVSGAIPSGYSRGDKLAVRIAASIAGVATKAVLGSFVLDSKRIGDLNDAAAGPTAAQVRQEMDANSTKLANLDATITSRAPSSTALSNATWTDARAARLDHLDADVSTRSVYAGGDTPGTTTLLGRIGSTITVTAGKVDVNDKTGFKLASDGLDTVSTTAPAGAASNFREMVVQTWRRFFAKATRTSTELQTFADNGTTVITTQTVSDDGTTQTQGAA